ncbi:hypothetical protein GCM10025778_10150 [Paeniglutamicibacter antarcticus]|uniref:Uncharacterized protein n=1 Tax=Paeniglutamicibacter antarcticus TaxID=494023 RepID=A0ABP9TL77_9MICC
MQGFEFGTRAHVEDQYVFPGIDHGFEFFGGDGACCFIHGWGLSGTGEKHRGSLPFLWNGKCAGPADR